MKKTRSMSKHTPGPWSALTPDQFGRPVQADWVVAGGDAYICVAPQWDEEYRDESLANARLIAAAPEMLQALQELDLTCTVDVLNPCWDNRPADIAGKHWGGGTACPHCIARAAISKATGGAA